MSKFILPFLLKFGIVVKFSETSPVVYIRLRGAFARFLIVAAAIQNAFADINKIIVHVQASLVLICPDFLLTAPGFLAILMEPVAGLVFSAAFGRNMPETSFDTAVIPIRDAAE